MVTADRRVLSSRRRGTTAQRVPVCLSIAGSDSGGGAGIQADLKAFAAPGVHGTTAITAITAQNTVAVTAVEAVSPAMIVAQVRAVVEDIGVDAVKIGMLGDVATIEAVARALDLLPAGTPVVVDPVMVAESGARLLDARRRGGAASSCVLPRATVVTPNLPEARVLARDGELDADGARPRRARARPARRRRHRRAPRDGHRRALRRRARSSRSPASAIPTAPRTARAARTPRRSPRASRSATTLADGAPARRKRVGRRGGARRPARARRGAGPVDALGSGRGEARSAPPGRALP